MVVFNMPENVELETDEQNTQDGTYFEGVCKDVIGVNIDIMEVVRLGKKKEGENKPRPVRVIVASDRQKQDVLRNAYKLRISNDQVTKNLYVKKDMTLMERREDEALWKEWKAKKEESEQAGDTLAKWIRRDGKAINVGLYPRGGPGEAKRRVCSA